MVINVIETGLGIIEKNYDLSYFAALFRPEYI